MIYCRAELVRSIPQLGSKHRKIHSNWSILQWKKRAAARYHNYTKQIVYPSQLFPLKKLEGSEFEFLSSWCRRVQSKKLLYLTNRYHLERGQGVIIRNKHWKLILDTCINNCHRIQISERTWNGTVKIRIFIKIREFSKHWLNNIVLRNRAPERSTTSTKPKIYPHNDHDLKTLTFKVSF